MFSRMFAQSLPRSSNTTWLVFNISRARVQNWSILDSRIPFLTLYRCFGRSKSNFSTVLDRTSLDCNSMSNVPLPKSCSSPQLLIPSIYEPMKLSWQPFKSISDQGGFRQGGLLRVVSWNIDFMAPGCTRRASTAMTHLKEIFGDSPPPLVIMLQEVNNQSLAAILTHSWVRNNFALSNVEAPQRYFTLMMVSRQVQARTWFRMPFPSRMGRDALVVDIPVLPSGHEPKQTNKILRLCTTHLESLPEVEGKERRPLQLAQASALMKAPPTPRAQIVAGLIGGDMNPISSIDTASHKAENVNLRDVWEDKPPPPIPLLKPFQKDLTCGRARGNTWGYQSRAPRARKRLDKFFWTGSVDTIPLPEAQDVTGKIGRLGIGVKTKVEVFESEQTQLRVVKGKMVEKCVMEHTDPEKEQYNIRFEKGKIIREPVPPLSDAEKEERYGIRKEVDTWVSDHFGITVGLRVI